MLKSSKANFLCKDAKNLLGQVTALVSMASIKTAEDALEAEKRLCEVADLQKEVNGYKRKPKKQSGFVPKWCVFVLKMSDSSQHSRNLKTMFAERKMRTKETRKY